MYGWKLVGCQLGIFDGQTRRNGELNSCMCTLSVVHMHGALTSPRAAPSDQTTTWYGGTVHVLCMLVPGVF